jgi:antitoxin component of MazEF toxin-antitoxin module
MQTNIVKWGNSQGIRLPKVLLDEIIATVFSEINKNLL